MLADSHRRCDALKLFLSLFLVSESYVLRALSRYVPGKLKLESRCASFRLVPLRCASLLQLVSALSSPAPALRRHFPCANAQRLALQSKTR
ncbi:hypothetical protein B0H11DRAFT_1998398, partial [Mycena galericulata]